MALGLAIIGLAPSIPVYILGWLVVGCGMGAGLYDAAFATLGRYYGYCARSAITTLTLYGGFASTLCWPLSALLTDHLGWRGACFVYAGIHLAVCLPLLILLLPRARPLAALPAPAGGELPTADLTGAPRQAFILLAVILTTGGASPTTSVGRWLVHNGKRAGTRMN